MIWTILQEKVVAGDFFELKQLLDLMYVSTDSDDLANLHDYYEILYGFYCDRTNVDAKIGKYTKRGSKNYINQIYELFARYFEADYLSKVVELCAGAATTTIAIYVVRQWKNINESIFYESALKSMHVNISSRR